MKALEKAGDRTEGWGVGRVSGKLIETISLPA
jgi:hypothetical protein